MSKVGIEASVIQTVQRAGAEWASKAEPTETAITLDGGQVGAGPESLDPCPHVSYVADGKG